MSIAWHVRFKLFEGEVPQVFQLFVDFNEPS